MSEKITKIGKLFHAESFLQLNTIRGYGYIDLAGRIVNEYHTKDNTPPEFTMSLQGLLIRNPKPKVDELKITPNSIWIHFSKPDSLSLILDNTIPEFKKVANILNIQELRRIGWRNYFIYEAKNKEDVDGIFLKNNRIKDLTTELVGYFIESNKSSERRLNGLLTMSKVFTKEKEDEKYGVLFDIDLFVKNRIDFKQLDETLNHFKEYITGEDKFLSVINEFIKK